MFAPDINLFNGVNDIIKSINAITKIDGPDAVLKVSEANNPLTTDVTPTIIDIKIICIGLFDRFRAIAAGIISKPVISRIPIILIDIAIIPDNRII